MYLNIDLEPLGITLFRHIRIWIHPNTKHLQNVYLQYGMRCCLGARPDSIASSTSSSRYKVRSPFLCLHRRRHHRRCHLSLTHSHAHPSHILEPNTQARQPRAHPSDQQRQTSTKSVHGTRALVNGARFTVRRTPDINTHTQTTSVIYVFKSYVYTYVWKMTQTVKPDSGGTCARVGVDGEFEIIEKGGEVTKRFFVC